MLQRQRKRRKSYNNENSMIYSKKGTSDQQSDIFNRTRSQRRKTEDEERKREQNRPPAERVIEDFGHTVFPSEIWDKIFLFLTEQDLRALTLTCKYLRLIANRILWDSPSFKTRMKAEDFETLLHLPIRKLHTYDLYFKGTQAAKWFAEMFEGMSNLIELEVCNRGKASNDITMETLRIIAPFVTKIITGGIVCEDRTKFAEELADIDFPKVQSVMICDTASRRYDKYRIYNHRYKLTDLQLINHLPITELRMNELQPDYKFDENGSLQRCRPVPFPQVSFLFQMKKLKKVAVNWHNSFGKVPPEIYILKELQSKNGVTLDVSQYCSDMIREVLLDI